MRVAKGVLRHWLPIAAVTTVLCLLVYLSVQQLLRQGANDPQIQMAEDGAAALDRGEPMASLVPSSPVDIARSLAPFTLVIDAAGRTVASSGLLHGRPPSLPPGVSDHAAHNREHRVTWQPEPGVRVALVLVGHVGAEPGVVAVGRSLRESEARTGQMGRFAAAAWLAALGLSLALVAAGELLALRVPEAGPGR